MVKCTILYLQDPEIYKFGPPTKKKLTRSSFHSRKLTGYPKSAYSPVQYGWIFAMAVVVFLMAVVMMVGHGAL